MIAARGHQKLQDSSSTSSGIAPKLGAFIAYLLGPLGAIFLIIEKDNKYMRFHAAQALVLNIANFIATLTVGIVLGAVLATQPSISQTTYLSVIIGAPSVIVFLFFLIWVRLLTRVHPDFDAGVLYKLSLIRNFADKLSP